MITGFLAAYVLLPVQLGALRPEFVLQQQLVGIGESLVINRVGLDSHALYLYKDTTATEIKSLADLERQVSVDSGAKALQLVRLLTWSRSPLRTMQAEITSRKDLTVDAVYGDRRGGALMLDSPEGAYGMLEDTTFKRLGLKKAVVKRDHTTYVVTRPVLIRDVLGHLHAREIVEQVGNRGEYVVLSLLPLSTSIDDFPWIVA